MNPVVAVVSTIWFLCVATNAEKQKALIFNRSTRGVIDLPNHNDVKGNCEAWATACPLNESTKAGKKFIEKHSITKKPLFVEEKYDEDDPINEVKKNICEEPFQMTAVHNLMNLSVELGYEVFFKTRDSGEFFNCIYENYHSIEQTAKAMKTIIKTGLFTVGNLRDRLMRAFVDDFGTMWYNESYQMKLIWIPIFKLRYSFSKMILYNLTYEIRRNRRWPVTNQCVDYSLGSEAYKGLRKEVDQLYADQRKLFKNLKVPSKPCAPGNESCELPCDRRNACLEKWSLIPLDQFHLFPSSPLHCSHMTTVPIWTKVAKEVLEKLDQYLYALFRILDTPLQIISGTKDQLTLPKRKTLSLPNTTLFLDPQNKKIPVPKLIYKIIKYELPDCDDATTTVVKICEYSAIIVIHNDPYFESKDVLCSSDRDITKHWGWDAITKDSFGNDRKNVYICPENKTTLKQIFGKFSLSKPDASTGDLDLSKFPVLNEDGTVGQKNIIADVDKKFAELLENGDTDLEFYRNDIEELSAGNISDSKDILLTDDFELNDDKF